MTGQGQASVMSPCDEHLSAIRARERATSPSEFSLVRFDQKKDHRDAAVASLGFAGAKMGVNDKARVALICESIASGVYKVTPSGDLGPGNIVL